MADIATAFDNAFTDLVTTMGSAATYTPSGGDAVSLYALVEKGVQPQPGAYDAQAWQQGITISARLDDLGQEPNRDDTIKVGATTYTVLAVLENDGQFVRVSVRE